MFGLFELARYKLVAVSKDYFEYGENVTHSRMFCLLPCKRSNGTDNLEETHIERLLDPESYIYDNGEDPIEVDCDKALPLEKK